MAEATKGDVKNKWLAQANLLEKEVQALECSDPSSSASIEKEHKAHILQLAADLDNTRKRHKKELEDALRAGKESMASAFLPLIDNLERASQMLDDDSPAAEGMRMLLTQAHEIAIKAGLTRVNTTNQMFDPNLHEAIQAVASELPSGTIVKELQGGYLIGNYLVRPALVVVAV
jgi:molecular chaperone GrpE